MKKTIMMITALVLVAVMSIGGTFAYLTSQDAVTNTFTVGKVDIELKETDMKSDERGNHNEYHMIPGEEIKKDPTVTVKGNSEDSYVFVEIQNNLVSEEISASLAEQIAANGWQPVEHQTNVYYQKYAQQDSDKELPVFQTIPVSEYLTNDDLAAIVGNQESETIVVNAYAIQQSGFENVSDAWTAVCASYGE